MRKITLTNNFRQNRTSFEDAKTSFIKFCKLKNLTERTIEFYEEDLRYFCKYISVKYLDEITQETLDNFILEELDKGKRTTTINTRLRGLRVFFKFCAERDYIEELSIRLLKDDAELKEPYTDAELRKLLARPKSNRWAEYRSWAMVNYLVATGNRARTIVNIKISDVNFDENTIHLRAMKNRHQQIIPLSPALKEVLEEYLSSWKWNFDDYLFPSSTGEQLEIFRFVVLRVLKKEPLPDFNEGNTVFENVAAILILAYHFVKGSHDFFFLVIVFRNVLEHGFKSYPFEAVCLTLFSFENIYSESREGFARIEEHFIFFGSVDASLFCEDRGHFDGVVFVVNSKSGVSHGSYFLSSLINYIFVLRDFVFPFCAHIIASALLFRVVIMVF